MLAVAASILTAAYYLLRNQEPYRDLGPLYLARLDQDRTAVLRRNCRRDLKRGKLRTIRREEIENQGRRLMIKSCLLWLNLFADLHRF